MEPQLVVMPEELVQDFTDLVVYLRVVATITGISIVPLVAWIVWADRSLRHIMRVTDKTLSMHERPESTGFGTVNHETLLRQIVRGIKELSYYTQWSVEERTGKKPPPYIGDVMGD